VSYMASDEERLESRQMESVVVLGAIRKWLDTKTEPQMAGHQDGASGLAQVEFRGGGWVHQQ